VIHRGREAYCANAGCAGHRSRQSIQCIKRRQQRAQRVGVIRQNNPASPIARIAHRTRVKISSLIAFLRSLFVGRGWTNFVISSHRRVHLRLFLSQRTRIKHSAMRCTRPSECLSSQFSATASNFSVPCSTGTMISLTYIPNLNVPAGKILLSPEPYAPRPYRIPHPLLRKPLTAFGVAQVAKSPQFLLRWKRHSHVRARAVAGQPHPSGRRAGISHAPFPTSLPA